MSCNSPCTIIFKPAFQVCCETTRVQCQKLAKQATDIECMISKAKDKGDLFVIVNKNMLNAELITGLEDACYKVEFIPNPPSCGTKPDENPNGVYKISWCICTCNCSSSSCCDDLPGHCWPTSLTCDDFPVNSCISAPIVTPPPVTSNTGCGCH